MKLMLFVILYLPLFSYSSAQTIQYKYDKDGRLVQVLYPNKAVKTYTYDKDGNRITQLDTTCKQPLAAFSASTTSGPCPLAVDFTDNSADANGASYEWTFVLDSVGSTQTSTSQNPAGITYNTAGSFLVAMKITNLCGTDSVTKSGYITVTCPTGIEEKPKNNYITVFPNPTDNIVNVIGEGVDNGKYTIQLRSITGQLLSEYSINVEDKQLKKQVSLVGYTNGMYYIYLVNRDYSWAFKVVKN